MDRKEKWGGGNLTVLKKFSCYKYRDKQKLGYSMFDASLKPRALTA